MGDRTLYRSAYVATMDDAANAVGWILVGRDEVVQDGRLVRADEEIAREHRVQARRFAG